MKSVNTKESLSLQIWKHVATRIETFQHNDDRGSFKMYHVFQGKSLKCSESQCSKVKAEKNLLHCGFLYYMDYPPLPHIWVDFMNISVSHTAHFVSHHTDYQQSPAQSWLEKEWEECVLSWESFIDSFNHPISGPYNSWWQPECGSHEALLLGQLEQRALSGGQVSDIAGAGQLESNFLCCLQFT